MRQFNRLSARALSSLNAHGRHADGGGLYLSISANGGRRWVFLYRWHGKPTEIGFGSARNVSLAQARQLAALARTSLAQRISPKEARKQREIPSFGDCAEHLIEAMRPSWRNDKHAAQWEMTLRNYAAPLLRLRRARPGFPAHEGRHVRIRQCAVGLFDLDLGTVELLGYHEHLANRIVVNPAGTLAASSSSDYTIGLWDLERRRLRAGTARAQRRRRGLRLRGRHDRRVGLARLADPRLGPLHRRDHPRAGGARERRALGRELRRPAVHLGRRHDACGSGTWPPATLVQTWGPFETETDSCARRSARVGRYWAATTAACVFSTSSPGPWPPRSRPTRRGSRRSPCRRSRAISCRRRMTSGFLIWDAASLRQKLRLESRLATWERSFNWSPDGRRSWRARSTAPCSSGTRIPGDACARSAARAATPA